MTVEFVHKKTNKHIKIDCSRIYSFTETITKRKISSWIVVDADDSGFHVIFKSSFDLLEILE